MPGNHLKSQQRGEDRKLAYLNEGVNYTDVGAGVEHFVEVGFSVHELQLVELLVIL